MKCLSTTTVAQLAERLHEQALEVALLRLVVDLQSRRLFHSQRDETSHAAASSSVDPRTGPCASFAIGWSRFDLTPSPSFAEEVQARPWPAREQPHRTAQSEP